MNQSFRDTQPANPIESHRTFLVCASAPTDTGLVLPVLENAGCAAALTMREGGYKGASFDHSRHAGLIILGNGDYHADNENVFATELSWVRAALTNRTAFLGICLGAQLLAHVGRAKLHYGKTLVDKGLTQLTLTKDGDVDPVVCCLKPGAQVAQHHWDTFTVPEGGDDLAQSTSRRRPHSNAFRIGRNAYGLQFHPEPTAVMLTRGWCLEPHVTAVDRAKAERTGRSILSAWVKLALRQKV